MWKHITVFQSYLSAPPVLYLLPSTNVITYCSGSRVIPLYPVYHAVTEVGVHGIWQTHLNLGHVQKQIKCTDSKIPADQVAISISQAVSPICHEAFWWVGGWSLETALCGCDVSTKWVTHYIGRQQLAYVCLLNACFYKLKCGFAKLNEILLWWALLNSCLICAFIQENNFHVWKQYSSSNWQSIYTPMYCIYPLWCNVVLKKFIYFVFHIKYKIKE